jgi:hypothetical protein
MKDNIQISVPNPCHEKWSSFSKTSNGSFCASCQKEVIDFTSWSDERIKSYFKNLTGNTCGYFREDQLKIYSCNRPGHSGISWIAFVFGFLLLFSSRPVSAQTSIKQTTEEYEPVETNENIQKAKSANVTIIGTVTSRETGEVMPGVKVRLKGTWNETLTDANGKFALDLPNKDSGQLIVFLFDGFKTIEYLHNVTRPGREIAVDMTRHELENIQHVLGGKLGGVVVQSRYEPKEIARDMWWWLTGR